MGTSSTFIVVAFKAALIDMVDALEALDGVQVGYHEEVGATARKERVWLGRCEGYIDPAAIRAGRQTRNEDFELDIRFRVTGASPKPEENEIRMAELVAAVESAIADDARMGGVVDGLISVTAAGYELETVLNGKQPLTDATLRVRAKARLQ